MKTLIKILMIMALFAQYCQSQDNYTAQMLHGTVKITCHTRDGETSIGTGFFYNFSASINTNEYWPVIVTCKHVISNSISGSLDFALIKTNWTDRIQPHFSVSIDNFESQWIKDPNPDVDIAVLPIAGIITMLQNEKKNMDRVSFDERTTVTTNEMANIGIFENVKFIGYPIGISDEFNNLPIAREGITATPPSIDYEGKKQFLIDAAVWPGSSGSPVFTLNQESIYNNVNFWQAKKPICLLGIIDQVWQMKSSGSIVVQDVPTKLQTNSITAIPTNLGIVIKAEVLDDFKPLLGIPSK